MTPAEREGATEEVESTTTLIDRLNADLEAGRTELEACSLCSVPRVRRRIAGIRQALAIQTAFLKMLERRASATA